MKIREKVYANLGKKCDIWPGLYGVVEYLFVWKSIQTALTALNS